MKMGKIDLHHALKVLPAIDPTAIRTGNAVTTGITIDTLGYDSCEFVVHAGAITDGQFAITMEDGNLADNSDMAAVAAADRIGDLPTLLATEDTTAEKVGYKMRKRYVRIKATQTGATTGGFICAQAVLGAKATQD